MKLPILITAQPAATFVTMSVPLVEGLLRLNTRNRTQRPQAIENYRRAIQNGLWVPTNQGIGVSAGGFLIDGQHRLEALRAEDYPPVTMLLVTGLHDDAMAAVDAGANRSPRDYLQFMFNKTVSALVSAMLRTSLLARDGFSVQKYQPQEYAAHLDLMGDSIYALMAVERSGKLPASVLAAMADAHMKGYQDEVISFARAVTTGEMLERDNPALVLRNWIASSGANGGATIMTERYNKTTSALRAWIDKRPLGKLYRRRTPLLEAQQQAAA